MLSDALTGSVLLRRYRVLGVLGQGGWSQVFHAHDERLLRAVAIKVFTGFTATERARERSRRNFIAEAYALSQLRHPNTLRIYDFGTLDDADDVPFQVSELMDGGTLAARVDGHGPMPPARAVDVVAALAGALDEAHSLGIIHRDIKPSNILFGKAGDAEVVKLADFSIAQTQDGAERDEGGQPLLFCSLGWSAPEQAQRAEVDRTVDVYGLALVLGYMLRGRRLKVHRQLSDFRWELERHDRAVDVALRRSGIPAPFADVIRRGARGRPEARFPSAAAFLDAARAALHGAVATVITPADATVPAAAVEELAVEPDAREPFSLDGLDPVLPDGRRVLVRGVLRDTVVQGSGPASENGPRLRVTLVPSSQDRPRVHVRGLNCFLQRPEGPPTGAVDLVDDAELELVSEARRPQGRVRIALGRRQGERLLLDAGGGPLCLSPVFSDPVLVELLPGGDAFLIHKR